MALRSKLDFPLCLALLWAAGCGDDTGTGRGEPLTRGDAGANPDASMPDASSPNEDEDAGPVEDDAGGLDSECRGDLTSFPATRVAEGDTFAASVFENRLELVYLKPSCGGTGASADHQGLVHASVPSSGDITTPQALVNLGDDVCYRTRHPAVVAAASPAFTALFLSNRSGSGTQLFAFGPALSDPEQISDEVDHVPSALTAALLGSKPKVAYALTPTAQSFPPPLFPPVAVRLAGLNGESHEVVAETEGFSAQRLTLTELGANSDSDPTAVLAWLSTTDDKSGIYLRALGAENNTVGDVQTLTTSLGATPDVALASQPEGGAVAYTTLAATQQVRFRTLDASGTAQAERRLTLGDVEVRELALSAYSTGYVLAYREVSLAGAGSIRVMFLNAEGKVGRTRHLAQASSTPSGLEVYVARDGRLFVVWGDPTTVSEEGEQPVLVGNHLHIARVTCP